MSDKSPKYIRRIKVGRYTYDYFRKKGFPETRLRGLCPTVAFWEHYTQLLKDSQVPDRPRTLSAETFGGLCCMYLASTEFTELRAATQRGNRKAINSLINVFGENTPINIISRKHILAYRQKISATPAGANKKLSVLRKLLNFAVDHEYLDKNPANGFKAFKQHRRRQFWTIEDETLFLECAFKNDKVIYLAYLLAIHTAQRKTDVLLFRPAHIQKGYFKITQSKTGTTVDVPLHPRLEEALKDIEPTQSFILQTEAGKPFQEANFDKRWNRIKKLSGINPDLWFRDLRRTAVVRLSMAELTVLQIVSVTGHSIKEANEIIETYFVATKELATQTMKKLVEYEKSVKIN